MFRFSKIANIVLSLLLLTTYYALSPHPSHAAEPFFPFSVEGNPPEEYYFESIFPLFTYVRPSYFQVYENEDLSRQYEALQICRGGGHDRRDNYCNNRGDNCTGGEVDLCYKGLRSGQIASIARSGSGSCNLPKIDDTNPYALREGTCDYVKTPKLNRTIQGTDFSESDSSLLTYPKLQSEAGRYTNLGDPVNPITYGSSFLALDQCERATRQLLVATRAKQTKATVRTTGEWPLGWVDWGYTTPNGTTLIDIHSSLPGPVSGYGMIIAEGIDDYYLNSAGTDIMSDISEPREKFCQAYSQAIVKGQKWALDLSQSPIYSPSFRQGYARGSICIWNICCPEHERCPLEPGPSRSLYYDISVSRAFGGALDELLLSYPLEQGAKIFRDAAVNNQLIRFLTSASTQAIPSTIITRLNKELGGDYCFDKRPNLLSWLNFSYMYDYLDNWEYLDPDKKCPGYLLQPALTKERGGAFPSGSIISRVINLILKTIDGNKVDDVDPVKYHLVTVPDAMGQSLSELQGHIYNTRDTLKELEKQNTYNVGLSNIVDDQQDYLYAGKYGSVADGKRFVALYPCSSSEYSASQPTSIEAYALGARNGCVDESTSAGLCDPTLFAKLIADSPWQAPLPQAVDTILNSKLFVGGKLNPELEEVYAKVSEETGVPCEILAGLHFEEGSAHFTDNLSPDPTKLSVTSGNPLEPGESLQDNATIAAKAFLRHPPTNTATTITAISNYNGSGNSNCQASYKVNGVPTPIPYNGCPKLYDGEDDPYATNMLDSRHTNMWLLYHSDNTAGGPTPYGEGRPGAFAVALTVYNEATSKNTPTDDEDTNDNINNEDSSGSNSLTPFTPKECGVGELDTALGCLPYSENLTSTILLFVIGLSGLTSLGVMLTGVLQIMTAAGDIEKARKGKELFTSAIVGLLFIIFSVTLLRTIAADLIKLPGWV